MIASASRHWATEFIGKPWRSGADGPDAYDCWGLVRAVMQQRAAVDLPIIDVADAADAQEVLRAFKTTAHYAPWRRVETTPQELDVALMTQRKHPAHVGIWLEADRGRMLHSTSSTGVVALDLVTLKREGYKVLGWYRHAERS